MAHQRERAKPTYARQNEETADRDRPTKATGPSRILESGGSGRSLVNMGRRACAWLSSRATGGIISASISPRQERSSPHAQP